MAQKRTTRTPKSAREREEWPARFLKAFEDTHIVGAAAKAAGVGRRTAYDRRERDPEFRQAWDDVVEHSTEELEKVAVKRAREGSDVLLIFLLKARRPGVYRERVGVEHSGPGGGPVQHRVRLDLRKLTDEQLRALEAIQPDHQPDSTDE